MSTESAILEIPAALSPEEELQSLLDEVEVQREIRMKIDDELFEISKRIKELHKQLGISTS